MRVLIVGAERLGRVLARDLLGAGHVVRVLDPDRSRLDRLPAGADTVQGAALDRDVLQPAAKGCDAVAAVTAEDAVNAVVAVAARREFHIPLAVAAVGDPDRASALHGLGVHVLCPTVQAARGLHLTLVRSDVEQELELGADASVFRAELPARFEGRRLGELERPGRLVPVAIERHGHVILADSGLELHAGDVLHAAATRRDTITDLARP